MEALHVILFSFLTASVIPCIIFNYLFIYCPARIKELDWLLSKNKVIEHYENSYGKGSLECTKSEFIQKRNYLIPTIMVFIVVFLATYLSVEHINDFDNINIQASTFGFIGSYIWSIYNLAKRTRGFDFSHHSITKISIKIMAFSVIGFLSPCLVSESIAAIFSFSIAAVPFTEVKRFLARQHIKISSFQNEGPKSSDKLNNLQGVSSDISSKLEDYGIESIHNLAFCNVIDLYLRSNTDRKTFIDIVDQALLWNYVGDKAIEFRKNGVRGAIELAELHYKYHYGAISTYEGQELDLTQNTQEVIKTLAKILGYPPSTIINLMSQIADDLQVLLVWDLWTESHETN